MIAEQQKFDGLTALNTIGMQLDPATTTEVFYRNPYTSDILPIKDMKTVFNLEQRKVASVVSKDYTLIEHRPIIEEYVDVLSKFNLNCFGNVYNYGNKMYVETAFGNRQLADGVKLGIRMKNSYDRFTSFGLEAFGFRTVCSNGMFLGKVLKKEVVVQRMHVGDINVREVVLGFIKELINQEDELQTYINNAIGDSLEWEIADRLLLSALNKKHKDAIFVSLFDALSAGKLTRWQFYNALTWYTSHSTLSEMVIDKVQALAQEVLVTPSSRLMEMKVHE